MNSEPNITMDNAPQLYRKLSVARTLALVSYVSLLVLFSVFNILNPEGSFTLWLLQCVPLMIFIPGLMQQRHRSYSWLCFVILLYFTWSVANVMSPLGLWRDWLVMIFSVVLFVAAMMTSRWLQHWQFWQSRQLN